MPSNYMKNPKLNEIVEKIMNEVKVKAEEKEKIAVEIKCHVEEKFADLLKKGVEEKQALNDIQTSFGDYQSINSNHHPIFCP